MKSKFYSLVDHLNAALFVFVENEFEYRDDPQEILAKILAMPTVDRVLLWEALTDEGERDLVTILATFTCEFAGYHTDVDVNNWLDAGELLEAIEILSNGEDTLQKNAEDVCAQINERLVKKHALNEIFLRFGIGHYPDYCQEVLNHIKTLKPTKSVRAYKRVPDDVDKFLEDVEARLDPDEFCVCIIDKAIDTDLEAGVSFVQELLERRRRRKSQGREGANIASVIFTSNEVKTKPSDRDDYFVIQANKRDIDGMTKGLAFCAYAELFGKLKEIHHDSIESATQLAWSKKSNVSFLAGKAHMEGITPFEAIQNWFHLIVEHGTTKRLLQDGDAARQPFQFMLGLTHFLNDEVLFTDEDDSGEIDTDYRELNTFEIFDYTVNLQHLPPAPGDVFIINGQYRVLVGQDCDFIVRQNGQKISRNLKHADILKAAFDPRGIDGKISPVENKVSINHFKDVRGVTGALQTRFTAQETWDFPILDTCAFNSDGGCRMDLDAPLTDDVRRLLPKFWHSHYERLQNTFNKVNQVRELVGDLELLKFNKQTVYDYVLEGNVVKFPITRICRIKKDFVDVLMKNYWNYRGRLGVNTISNSKEEEIVIPVFNIGKQDNFQIEQNDSGRIKAHLIRSASSDTDIAEIPLVLQLTHLKQRHRFLQEITDETVEIEGVSYVHPETGILFEKFTNHQDKRFDSIKITQPLLVEATGVKFTDGVFDISLLLNHEQMAEIMDNPEAANFKDDEGKKLSLLDPQGKPISYSIEYLRKGIKLHEFDVQFKLQRAVVHSTPLTGGNS